MYQPGSQNIPSIILSHEENDLVFTLVGQWKQTKATAVVQMFHAHPDRHSWTKFKTGVVCFVKDNIKKSYYIRLFDLSRQSMVYEQELYNQFTYKQDRPYFHSFPGDKYMVGLNFADEREASQFFGAVDAKVKERQEKRATMKRRREEGLTPIKSAPGLRSGGGKARRPRKRILKEDIGLPSDFRHLAHVGFDPSTGTFDSNNVDPEWKKLLDMVGVSDEQLQDQNTAKFIYDFVEKHGGIQEASRPLEATKNAAPPPHLGPPLPPKRGSSLGHILTKQELQVLANLLATYSDERLEEIKLTIQEEQAIRDISREEIERFLRRNGLSSIADGLKDSLEKGIENVKHHEAYEKALEDGLCLTLRYLKFLFFGPPRSGKTSTRRRLVREIVNLSELDKPSPSTGVAESHDVIIKKLSFESAVISKSQWLSMKRPENEEKHSKEEKPSEEGIQYITQIIINMISKNNTSGGSSERIVDRRRITPAPTMTSQPELTSSKPDQLDETKNTNPLRPNTSLSAAEPTIDNISEIAEVEDEDDSDSIASALSTSEKGEIKDAFDKLLSIVQSDSPEEIKRLLEDLILINMMDVGGQPSFLEMLPALTISPALYFLFFRLDQELKKQYPVRFRSAECEAEVTLETSYCIEDVLYQCLASISCFSCHLATPESASRPQASSSAFLIATYKDQVKDDQISQIESTLQGKLKPTQAYQEGILLKSSKGKMFLTVDNMHGTDESEMLDIRKEVESAINRYFPPIPIPLSWLMFKIVLQLLDKPVVSIVQCEEIAKQLNMSSPVQDALWFFHHDVGSLLHYTSIPSMKDTVICNPQVIFDCISTLIIDKFQYGNIDLPQSEVDEFLQKGMFSLSHIKEKTENQQSSHLSLEQLSDVLQHLNIMAEVKDESNPSQSERKFIMPAVLKYASEKELEQPPLARCQQLASPIMVRFEGGFVPFGIFCATIAHLIARQGSFSPKWQLHGGQVRRNKITFCVDGALYVTLISQPQFIKIFAFQHPHAKQTRSLPYLCSCIRQTVIEALETVMSKMKYKPFKSAAAPSKQPFDLAFACCLDDTHGDHMMTVVEDEDGLGGKCLKGGILLDLDDEHLIWFKDSSIFQKFQNLYSTESKSTASRSAAAVLASTGQSLTATRHSTSPSQGLGASASSLSQEVSVSPTDTQAIPYESHVHSRHLKLIKWTDERGETQKFNLMERISFKWRDVGELLLSFEQLHCIAEEHRDKHMDCCRAVLHHWLENPPEEYPITWRGLIELLQDSELGQVVAELKNALSKSNIE